jgi:type IX secretion system PorP/SprF family membrane protein
MKKRICLLGLLIVFALTSSAQQDPYFAHFPEIKPAYNPAAIGITPRSICVSMLTHQQWIGFDDETHMDRTGNGDGFVVDNVGPVTNNFNLSGDLYFGRSKPVGAIGISLLDDVLGYMKSTSFKIQASGMFHLDGISRLAIGFEGGWTQFGFVNPKFRARHPNDPNIPFTSVFDGNIDAGMGFYYERSNLGSKLRDFYAGVSFKHLNKPGYLLQRTTYTSVVHSYITTGVKMRAQGGLLVVSPEVLLKYNTRPQIDLRLTAVRQRRIKTGLAYRQFGNVDAISLFGGLFIQSAYIGYSYDRTISNISTVSNGTHELVFTYCWQRRDKNWHKTVREL